jgi:outer membrane phospholipase A
VVGVGASLASEILSFRPNPQDRVTEVTLGGQHESNGLGKDANVDQTINSRGWNNVFLSGRYGFDRRIPAPGIEIYLTLGLRAWWPFAFAPSKLPQYIGHGIATANLDIRLLRHPRFDQIALELIAHERSVEGSVYFPLAAISNGHVRFSIYGQVFYGDAERLLNLDQKVTNYYVGFGFI